MAFYVRRNPIILSYIMSFSANELHTTPRGKCLEISLHLQRYDQKLHYCLFTCLNLLNLLLIKKWYKSVNKKKLLDSILLTQYATANC